MSLYADRDTRPDQLPLPPMPVRSKNPAKGKGGDISLGAYGTGRSLVRTGVAQERTKRSKKRY